MIALLKDNEKDNYYKIRDLQNINFTNKYNDYDYKVEEIASAFTLLLGLENVKVNYPERLAQAITWHKQGLDFADALHLANSQHCKKLYTFDKKMITKAKHLEGSKVLAPDL